ncbi:MAG: arylsulfatase [Planctomycetota bacterium]|jgi:arylsulfatase
MPVTRLTLLLVCFLAFTCPTVHAAQRPNVLIVMVDDLGFSDVGCYGSEIDTPPLDALAANGLRFRQFYNTAKCHSSRISLLTGQYAYQAGNTAMSHGVTSAETLRTAGYHTMMVGKWHLQKQPTDFGFDRYFGHLSGACNFFTGDKTFRLNGEPWQVPESGFYTTVAKVDFALDFLKEARQTGKPWYLYVAFNAPHAPLQALEPDYRKYEGRYDRGWDMMRAARLAKQKRIGLFDASLEPSPRPEHIPAWKDLGAERQAFEAKRMTTLAAMIDRVDQEIGRLVADLRRAGELDNTMILFVSDNGACPYDRLSQSLTEDPIHGGTAFGDSTGWAWARNSPFRFYKQNQFEGGVATPGILHWPAGLKTQPGAFVDDPAHLIDVLPTLVEICDAPIPTSWPGRELRPVSGVSLTNIFNGQPLGARPPIHLQFGADRALRDGPWKAVSFRAGAWELYRMDRDRTELHDLAAEHPERLASMVATWTEMAQSVLHAPQKVFTPVSTSHEKDHPEWTDFSKPLDLIGKRTEPKNQNANAQKAGVNVRRADRIRARKYTRATQVGDELRLTFSGDDPGLAIDRIKAPIAKGPYTLRFELNSTADADGEVYFTIDNQTTLPNGVNVPFVVNNDGRWHDVSIDLTTDQTIYALRLDVSGGPGKASIRNLRLTDTGGKVLRRWADIK